MRQNSPDGGRPRRRWLIPCRGLLLAALLAAPASLAAEEPASGSPDAGAAAASAAEAKPDLDALLSQDVWRDSAYGVGLRLPLGARYAEHSAAEAVLRMVGPEQYTVNLYLKKSQVEIDLVDVANKAQFQFSAVESNALQVGKGAMERMIGGRLGALQYMYVPERDKQPAWVFGQAYMLINHFTLAVFEFRTAADRFEANRVIFEAMLDSVDVMDPQAIHQQRLEETKVGLAVMEQLTFDLLRPHLEPVAWFRVREAGRDVGYMKVTQKVGEALNLPGIHVDVEARLALGDGTYDTLSNFFLSKDGTREIWSIRTTARPKQSTPGQEAAGGAWTETGLRNGDRIDVQIQGPSGVKKYEWNLRPEPGQPDIAYLSQVQVHMVGSLLAPFKGMTLGFYAYYPNAGRLSYRRLQVKGGEQADTYEVRMIPGPEYPEQVTVYKEGGRFVEQRLTGGRTIVPASEREIRSLGLLPR